MYNANKPSVDELPSSAQLLRSTIIAIFAAAALLVTIVLPSEYGIDPTGAGRMLGLTEMGEIKTQLAEEAEADRRLEAEAQAQAEAAAARPPEPAPEAVPEETATLEPAPAEEPVLPAESVPQEIAEAAPAETPVAAAEPTPPVKKDEVSITLTPGEGAEIKLVMKGGAKARFEWTANGGLLNYDTHGNGGGQRISYEKGRAVPSDEGVLEAAFDGNHGWFWRNRTDVDVTMTLKTEGDYSEMKRVM